MGASASGAVIGLDARSQDGVVQRAFFDAPYFAEMRARILALGHTIVPIADWTAVGSAGVDAILVQEAFRPAFAFTAAEAAAIAAFNDSGKGVAYFADGGFDSTTLIDSNNLVANALGASFEGSAVLPNGFIVDEFVVHPLFENIASWGLDFHRRVTPAGGPDTGVDLTVQGLNSDAVVARDLANGRGNAVVFGDATWMSNAVPGSTPDFGLSDLDNLALFDNTIEYLLVPSPGAASLLGVAALTVRRRRR